MELIAGYKNTEIGIIPDEWEVKKQKEIVRYINGRAYSLHEWEKKGIPVVRLQNLTKKGGNFYYSNLNLPDYQYMNKGDLIFMWSASFGPYIWWGNKAIFHYHIWKLECKKGKAVKDFYYFKLLEITEELKKGTSGSTMLHLTKGFMENYLISVPPLPEQTAIANVLSDTDNLLQTLEKKIAKKRLIKQGAMQELLKPKEGWVVKSLGKVADIATGTTPPTRDLENYGNQFCFVSPADLGKEKYITKTVKNLSKKGFSVSRIFPKNSIMVTCIGSTIGKIGIASKVLTSNQQINAIFPNENFDSEFVYYHLSLNAKKIRLMASEQAVPMINKSEFSEVKINIPLLKSEQTKIATILSDMDTEIESLEKQLSKYKQVKQGLMQNLLTGKIRLV
ncbi:restriction modification system DNA specificity domain protein [Cellulophaga algicola DSM 14237]|uniref:Restriction modification system DNA specificity domain protein n=1 Tax=Cellulophaga algicola (strain DSM 14237 / IC166 / ACAM 630) TaxID=688270 RepID=E6X613_CELAD|nr:restriction endonuclease subunit S [Cellulophaga algicola]ADV50572.1 restriction modification system DNA specificity domain protein [Cellulophaga algicola DSM 14237]